MNQLLTTLKPEPAASLSHDRVDASADESGLQELFDVAFAFRRSKVLLSAVELGLFSVLAEAPLDSAALARRLGLHGRGARDLFDALVALRLLHRDDAGRYSNSATCATFLDTRSPAYVGDRLDYLNASAFPSWCRLTDALRSGRPQAGPFAAGGFSSYYAERSSLELFAKGMTAGSLAPARALARKFDWGGYRTFVDIGAAQGGVAAEIAIAHPHLTGRGFDLPSLEPVFNEYIKARGLSDRVVFHAGDFTRDPLPPADVLLMGRILHDWDRGMGKRLLRKAWRALPRGGALIVWEAMIDDSRREHVEGLLSSLNMLLNTDGGEESTVGDCVASLHAGDFRDLRIMPLGGPYTAVAGIKVASEASTAT